MGCRFVPSLLATVSFVAFAALPSLAVPFRPIEGLSDEGNARVKAFLAEAEGRRGRKVAVFDFDGTLCGQRPNYADSELFVRLAEEGLIDNRNLPSSPVTSPKAHPVANLHALKAWNVPVADRWRVRALEGLELRSLRRRCTLFMLRHYRRKIFRPMAELVRRLHRDGFEVWVVTAATEAFVEGFIAQQFAIPPTRIVGMRSEIHDGKLTATLAGPLTDGEGKVAAIETTLKAVPMLVAGNSGSDVPMLRLASDLAIIVNPDAERRDLARRKGWLIESMPDEVLPDAPHLYRHHGGKANP